MTTRLRHVAIASADPDTSVGFFTDVLGWTLAGKIDSRNARGYYVTDGHINIALLCFKNRPAAGMEFPEGYTGLHHIGFQCDDINAIVERFENSGFAPRHDVNLAQGLGKNPAKDNAEYKMTGPENVMVDVSERGWAGTESYKGSPAPA
ncbi:VOC family protein [Brevundimonas bullata]|uniref:VOC family protein n=1 Tax=Brevundimonas bullata TaxID=13160 RepID=UPI000E0A4B8A|nr:VOC family protein [Brevundimonas bullata]WQE36909.1 VOC family protein [Brevundimonas bullata]